MEIGAWLGWQLDYLLYLQNLREVTNHMFDGFFLYITTFGEIIIPILFITLIYWCVNKKAGQFLLWNFALGFVLNVFLKITACIYRPWILSSQIHPVPQAIPGAGGYSFPSGHTANSVAVWGGSAFWWRNNKIIFWGAISLLFLIMFSRNYLGVHTPQDVVVSFIIGILLLFIINKTINYVDNNKNGDFVVVTIITCVIALLIPYLFLKSYPCHYLNGKILYDTFDMKLFSSSKAFCTLGLFWGWLIENRFVRFSAENGSVLNKTIRYLLGVLGLLFLLHLSNYCTYFGNIFFNNMFLYFIIGLFITLIHPLIFKQFCNK